MAILFKCPDCSGKFKWAAATEKWPEHCPLCGAYVGIEGKDEVVLPAFLSARSKANDQVYRDIEKASEHRAEQAAQMAGVPVSEMSGLKITNLNDRKDTQTAHMPVQNVVTQQMEFLKARGGQDVGFAQNGAELAGGISTGAVTVNGQTVNGVAPRAGMTALKGLQRLNGRG